MPKKIELVEDVVSKRGQAIRKLLIPISQQQGGPAHKRIALRSEIIIGALETSPLATDYRSWRFPTTTRNYRGMYFERWVQIPERPRSFYLDRAYLHIYRLDRNTAEEKEVLCLHCDPNEPDDAPHALYKKGPHLHLMMSEQPFPHSHIALTLLNLEEILTSVDNLTKGLHKSIMMIKEQFLEPLKE